MGFFDQLGGGNTGNSGGPLASLMAGDPRQLMQLLSGGRVSGPQAMTPQWMQPGNPAGAPALNGAPMPAVSPQQQPLGALQQMMMQAGMGGNPGDPHSFLHSLLAEDHDARRRLARSAAEEGWSVRVAEARARESNGDPRPEGAARRKRAAGGVHPDQEQAAGEIAEALSAVLGADVQVKPTRAGGYRAELSFASREQAIELARRLRPRAVI